MPDSVIVYNTPQRSRQQINADLGGHAQDSWTLNRFTLNPGVRFEYSTSHQRHGGRARPLRGIPVVSGAKECAELAQHCAAAGRGLRPDGDAKTAIRFGFNKYHTSYGLNATAPYDPMSLKSDTRNWSDCAFLSHVHLRPGADWSGRDTTTISPRTTRSARS